MESGLDVGFVEGAVVAVLWEIGVVLGEDGAGLGGVASETGIGVLPDGETVGNGGSSSEGTGVGGSSVEVREHLQFQRSPGRCWSQKGWPMGRMVFQ